MSRVRVTAPHRSRGAMRGAVREEKYQYKLGSHGGSLLTLSRSAGKAKSISCHATPRKRSRMPKLVRRSQWTDCSVRMHAFSSIPSVLPRVSSVLSNVRAKCIFDLAIALQRHRPRSRPALCSSGLADHPRDEHGPRWVRAPNCGDSPIREAHSLTRPTPDPPVIAVIAVQEQRMGAAAAAAAAAADADVTRCTTWVAPRQGIRQAHGRAPPCSYGGTPTSQEEEEEEDEGEEGWKLDAGKHNFLGARHNSHVQQQQQQPGQHPPRGTSPLPGCISWPCEREIWKRFERIRKWTAEEAAQTWLSHPWTKFKRCAERWRLALAVEAVAW